MVASERYARLPVAADFTISFVVALIALYGGGAALLYFDSGSPILHTILDMGVVIPGMLAALLLWEFSRFTSHPWPLFLAVTCAFAAAGELLHTLTVLGGLSDDPSTDARLRAATWGPVAHLMPIGFLAALVLQWHKRDLVWPFGLGMLLIGGILVLIFVSIPRYSDPPFVGLSRPNLVLVPLLWGAVALGYRKQRYQSANANAITWVALTFLAAHIAILFSDRPDDGAAMFAHYGKFVAYLLLLFNITQIGASDTTRRHQLELELKDLNRELDTRVSERTARLNESNARLRLLEQVTRAINRRQDVKSIFEVAARTLEEQLPADFVCVCRYDAGRQRITTVHIGSASTSISEALGLGVGAEISLGAADVSRSLAGKFVYEPDIRVASFPFSAELAQSGLRSLVSAPLMAENEVVGILIVAQRRANGFDSTDCEFLRQLGEHVALAVNQADLRADLEQAYDELHRSQQAVLEQERLRAIGQMASGIAHDINNAISPIAIYTQSLIERDLPMDPEVRDYVELVGRVTKDVGSTVGRMRDFYRRSDDAGEFTAVELNELVRQVVELTRARWSDMAQRQGVVIKVSVDLESDLPPVLGNASEIREALTNLIFNAVDAMPSGGKVRIRTCSVQDFSADAVKVRLEVKDDGVGMDEQTRSRCLEPFFTTKGERGTGLGLAMVYGSAQRHQAHLSIDSAPGEGTSVAIDFAAAERQERAAPADARDKARPLRILLADDDPAVLHSTVFVLKHDGHEITAVDGGQSALDALQSAHSAAQPFDIMITDLGMPYVDGNQVARAAKDLFPHMPVVLLTGWGRRMAQGDEAPAYVDYLLPKPLELEDLRKIFEQIA